MLDYKQVVFKKVIIEMHDRLEAVQRAAAETHANSTSEESKAEGKYDTRGVEASYLAGAQAEQLSILEESVAKLDNLSIEDEPDTVLTGSLIVISSDSEELNFMILPAGGGLSIEHDNQTTLIITPTSPLGIAMLGQEFGAEIDIEGHTGSYISEIY